jgi:hypothetical protein
MKIYEIGGSNNAAPLGNAQGAQKTGRSGAGQSGAAGGVSGGDTVEFSPGLGQLSRAVSSYGTARSQQVDALAALYQSGGYQSDSMATSRAMISEALSGISA